MRSTLVRDEARGAPAGIALLLAACLALAGCAVSPTEATAPLAPPAGSANRPDGEGYAGVGELLVRIGVQQEGPSWTESLTAGLTQRKRERAFVEIRYQGLDSLGRAVFERRDGDALAAAAPNTVLPTTAKGTVLAPTAAAVPADADPAAGVNAPPATPNTRDIALDLRLSRQLHIQGKIVEVVEATASGVVFRLY
jgi:hypothetical protein